MDGIKIKRTERGLTQAQLADRLGVTQSLIGQWERGETLPSAAKLPAIADTLGCSIDALFNRPASNGQ